MDKNSSKIKRIVGVDMHPDVFSAAFVTGNEAMNAQVQKLQDRVATNSLCKWAEKNLNKEDIVVMEASGNSFEACFKLHEMGFTALVLESFQASRVKHNYCNDDKASAIKLAQVYLSGLAKIVWQPDEQTRERREVFFSYRNCVKDSTRIRNRIRSYLSDHMVRLPKGTALTQQSGLEKALKMKDWSELQRRIIRQYFEDLWYVEQRRKELNAFMVDYVIKDRELRGLLSLLGIRHIAAFAIGAIVGSIHRFSNPKKLVGYLGFAPSKVQSGNNKKGHDLGIGRKGRGDLRNILIQSAQNALEQTNSHFHKWGWKLCIRKGRNVAVAAIGRKLTISIWHLLKGHFTPAREPNEHLKAKVAKLATLLGRNEIKSRGFKSNKEFILKTINLILYDSCLENGALPQTPLLIAGEARDNN